MAYKLSTGFQVGVQVSYVDAKGHPAAVDGPVTWSSSDATIATVTADAVDSTLATVVASVLQGAHIVRVHDVGPALEAVRVADEILRS